MMADSSFLDTAQVDALFIPTEQPEFRVLRANKRILPERLTATLLAAIVLIAPLPVASNHPLAWLGLGGGWSAWQGRCIRHLHEAVQVALTHKFKSWSLWAVRLLVFGLWQAACCRLAPALPRRPACWPPFVMATYLAFFVLMLRIAENRRIAARISQVLFFGVALHALLAMVVLNFLGDSGILVGKDRISGGGDRQFH